MSQVMIPEVNNQDKNCFCPKKYERNVEGELHACSKTQRWARIGKESTYHYNQIVVPGSQ